MQKSKLLNKLATALLMMGMFFNPFGMDILIYLVIKWTGSYMITISIFYFLAGLCFLSYFLLRKKIHKNENK